MRAAKLSGVGRRSGPNIENVGAYYHRVSGRGQSPWLTHLEKGTQFLQKQLQSLQSSTFIECALIAQHDEDFV